MLALPRPRPSIIWLLVLPIPVVMIAALSAVWFLLPQQIAENARSSAVLAAEQTVAQFTTVRGYYTKNVIGKALESGALKPSIDHKGKPGTIPLPATFIHDLSAELEKQETTVKLYSAFPFPNREERQLDAFQQQAWNFLRDNPDSVFVRREKQDGKEVVRVAMADKMAEQGCVNCHNAHPDTPKSDWKLGDVRGVLEVTSSVAKQLAAGKVLTRNIIIGAFAIGLVLMMVPILAARRVVGPLAAMKVVMERLAGGDKDAAVSEADAARRDEIGEIARTVSVFREGMIENDRLHEEQREAERTAMETEKRQASDKRAAEEKAEQERRDAAEAAAAERKKAMLDLADGFEAGAGSVISSVSKAAAAMQTAADAMNSTADRAAQQTAAVAAASEEASSSVRTVAAAAEELSASIQEISRQVAESATITDSAVSEAEKTNEQVQGLANAAHKIGEVVNLINDIASQTNLLALNATIEAARAGEAGKGFAVVATEVKSLADQTAKATDEIAGQIGEIQEATNQAVSAISGIGGTIGRVNDIASSIAAAVEQQGAATEEIAVSIQQAAAGTQDVSKNIDGVTSATKETGSAANQVMTSAEELARQADELRGEVDSFLQKVRAG